MICTMQVHTVQVGYIISNDCNHVYQYLMRIVYPHIVNEILQLLCANKRTAKRHTGKHPLRCQHATVDLTNNYMDVGCTLGHKVAWPV